MFMVMFHCMWQQVGNDPLDGATVAVAVAATAGMEKVAKLLLEEQIGH